MKSYKKSVLAFMLPFIASQINCTYKNYTGEAGLRRLFPSPRCGTVQGTLTGYTAQVNPDIDEKLFAEFGYCLPYEVRRGIEFVAAYHHGSFVFYPKTLKNERANKTIWEVSAEAPDIDIDPRAWLYALQDADHNDDGWIMPEETTTLESRAHHLMWKEQIRSGHSCQEARYKYGKSGRLTYQEATKGIKNCPYKPSIRK